MGLGFKPNLFELKSPYEIIEKGRHDVLRLRLVLEAIKARSLLACVEHIALVELGHKRLGEGHVDAATTPPALGLGIGVLLAFRQASLALCLSGGRLVRGRLLFLALDVRGRRLFLALLVPNRIIGCEDLRSLKKKLNQHS